MAAGLLALARRENVAACSAFESVLAANAAHPTAVNNHALCLMLSRDVAGALRNLEKGLQQNCPALLAEPLVHNLASMYELAAGNATEAKQRLQAWLSTNAPDDFDPACLRLPA